MAVEQCFWHKEDLEDQYEGKQSGRNPEDVSIIPSGCDIGANDASDGGSRAQEESIERLTRSVSVDSIGKEKPRPDGLP